MVTRIRYVKDLNGNLVTRVPLLLAGELVNITLSPEHLSYVITNANDGRVIATDTAKSMQMLKINVKKQLRSRGAVFNDEVRSRELSAQQLN